MKVPSKAIIIASVSAALVLTAIVFFAETYLGARFPENTYIANIEVSGKTPQEAKILLQENAKKYLTSNVSITANGQQLTTTPQNLGVEILIDETISETKTLDVSKLPLYEYFFSQPATKIDNDFIVSVNEDQLEAGLSKLGIEDVMPVSANYYFGTNGKLAISEGRDGVYIDKNILIKTLKDISGKLKATPVNIAMTITPPTITKEQLEAEKGAVMDMLRLKLTLLDPIAKKAYYLNLTEHLDWIKFIHKQKLLVKPFGEKYTLSLPKYKPLEDLELFLKKYNFVSIEIDPEKFNKYIDDTLAKKLDVPVDTVKIYKDEKGNIVIEGRGENGSKIDRNLLKKSIETAVENGIDRITMPILEMKPTVQISDELKKLGITEIISVGRTSYYGSPPNRVFNIKVGATKLNGALIAPDEVFSFNKRIGPVDGSHGFLNELVIKPEGIVPESGGGLCQVSTTTYRAALFAGLPIVHRQEHSFAIAYYAQVLGHGLDATVYTGSVDLKVKNDTGKHILVQAYVKNNYELFVIMYGTADGRKVEMEGPYTSNYTGPGESLYIKTSDLPMGQQKRIEKGFVGFRALWYRYITKADGQKIVEEIKTLYKYQPAKILVGN